MPTFNIPSYALDISRKAALVDTNVLFAAFWPHDERSQNAREFLFEVWEHDILLPFPVLIETWGMLVGKNKSWEGGIKLLNWINDPGSGVTLLPQHTDHSSLVRDIASRMRIDCVDAILAYLADEFTKQCKLSPPMSIVTYDTADYLKCLPFYKLHLVVLDPDTMSTYP